MAIEGLVSRIKKADGTSRQLAFSKERLIGVQQHCQMNDKRYCDSEPEKPNPFVFLSIRHASLTSPSGSASRNILTHVSSFCLCRVRTRDTVSINSTELWSSSKHLWKDLTE
jgi:hypothetical protein